MTAIGSQIADLRRSVETLERGQSHTQSILEGCNKKYEKVTYFKVLKLYDLPLVLKLYDLPMSDWQKFNQMFLIFNF